MKSLEPRMTFQLDLAPQHSSNKARCTKCQGCGRRVGYDPCPPPHVVAYLLVLLFYRFGPGAIFTFLCPHTSGEMRRGAVNLFVAQLLIIF